MVIFELGGVGWGGGYQVIRIGGGGGGGSQVFWNQKWWGLSFWNWVGASQFSDFSWCVIWGRRLPFWNSVKGELGFWAIFKFKIRCGVCV